MNGPRQKEILEGFEIAGLGARAFAFTVDLHLRAIIAVLWVGICFFTLIQSSMPYDRIVWITYLPAALIYFLYHPVIEMLMKGDTPGRRYAEVQLVTQTGSTPKTGAILIRNIFRLIDSLPLCYVVGIIACLRDKQYRRLGDRYAGTLLVYRR